MHDRSVEEGMVEKSKDCKREACSCPKCPPNRFSRAGNVDEQDIEVLLQVSDESLPNDDFQKLAEQKIHAELKNSDSETIIVYQIVANDPDFERSGN